jgi:hypothetical protein
MVKCGVLSEVGTEFLTNIETSFGFKQYDALSPPSENKVSLTSPLDFLFESTLHLSFPALSLSLSLGFKGLIEASWPRNITILALLSLWIVRLCDCGVNKSF